MTSKDQPYRYYRVCAAVNLDFIRANLYRAKQLLAPGVRMMAVIKADGYGHGAIPIMHAIDDLVDAYGVATVAEAVELRNAGTHAMILILGYTAQEELPAVVQNQISQTVFCIEAAEQLAEEAARQHTTANIHIKLDTGMHRIGFLPCEQSIHEIARIAQMEALHIEGIFSHLACADCTDKQAANEQIRLFDEFLMKLSQAGVVMPIRHIANTAAMIDMPDAQYDMVRFGIGLYGLYPSVEVDRSRLPLLPAMELKTHISFVKTVEAGQAVGYGGTFVTTKPTVIATIPVGYADGYPRKLSNCGSVLIHGMKAPIIGRICMDQFMVDVSEIPNVKQGDMVTLVGKDGAAMIPVEEPAELAESFNYEFICNIGKRIPRIYIKTEA